MRGNPSFFLLLPAVVFVSSFIGFPFVEADTIHKLPEEEISTLRQIDAKLKIGWDFSLNPCNGIGKWNLSIYTPGIVSKVTCGECNNLTNLCHVSKIELKGQNLTGILPPDFANLTHLKHLDLALNYFHGTLPLAWASLPLVNLSVMANQLTGRIPDEIGNITSLEYIGYMAPEYAMRGYLTYKADVYSFGVVMLETLSGKSNTSFFVIEETIHLLDWAYILKQRGDLLQLVDPALGDDYPKEEALALLNLAVTCANPSAIARPAMSTVVSMLEGQMLLDDQSAMQPNPSPIQIPEDSLYCTQWKDLSMENPWLNSGSTATTCEGYGKPLCLDSFSGSMEGNTCTLLDKKASF